MFAKIISFCGKIQGTCITNSSYKFYSISAYLHVYVLRFGVARWTKTFQGKG